MKVFLGILKWVSIVLFLLLIILAIFLRLNYGAGKDYPDWLRKAGFTVVEFDKDAHYTADIQERYRLGNSEILYIVSKQTFVNQASTSLSLRFLILLGRSCLIFREGFHVLFYAEG